jgi:hypothetical protein
VDPQFVGLAGFAFPDVTGPGASAADPGYFTLGGFAMPWAGMAAVVRQHPAHVVAAKWAPSGAIGATWQPRTVIGAKWEP